MSNPTFVQSRSTTGTGNLSLAFSSPNTSQNAVIVLVGENMLDTFSVSDSQGNSYQSLALINDPGNGSWQVFYSFGIKSGSNTVSCTPTINTNGNILAIHEVSVITALDTVANNSGTGLAQDSGGATTSNAIEFLFGFTGYTGSSVFSLTGSGLFTQAEKSVGGAFGFLTQWRVVTSTGTYNSTSTTTTGKAGVSKWVAEIANYFGPQTANTDWQLGGRRSESHFVFPGRGIDA